MTRGYRQYVVLSIRARTNTEAKELHPRHPRRSEYAAALRSLPDNLRCFVPPLAPIVLTLAWICASGCALEQRMAVEVIDAPLRESGQELQASRGMDDAIHLGPYTVCAIERHNTRDGTPLLPDLKPRPSTFYHLSFELQSTDAHGPTTSFWTRCIAERRVAQNSDFAAAAGESHDEVALTCSLRDTNANTWTLSALGDVSRGLSGRVQPTDKTGPQVQPSPNSTFEIEVLARRRFFRAVARELPFPVAQLRREHRASAAMLLDTPERAWLAEELNPDDRLLALATMLALRLLPLGEGALGR